MGKILVIEDDRNLNEGVCLALRNAETSIMQCYDLVSAREILKREAVDLILLDINLPDGSGLDLLQEVKKTSHTAHISVILLTANDTELDVVMGLEYGADDYITKPFSLAILRARANTQLRRAQENIQRPFVIDDFKFDFEQMEFLRRGTIIDLSKTEQKLLRVLVENRGITMTRDALLDRVWGADMDFVDENTLSVAVKRLRDKLGAADYIKTVYGIGYVWVVDK